MEKIKELTMNPLLLRKNVLNVVSNFNRARLGVKISVEEKGDTYVSIKPGPGGMQVVISLETVVRVYETSELDSIAIIVSFLISHELGHVNIAFENKYLKIDTSSNEHERQNIAEDLEINWRSGLPNSMGIHAHQYGYEEYRDWDYYYSMLSKESEDKSKSSGSHDQESSDSPGKSGLSSILESGKACNCNTEKLKKQINILTSSQVSNLKGKISNMQGAVQSELAANNPILDMFENDDIPEEWEEVIKNLKVNSRDSMEIPHSIESSFFRINNRRSDDGVMIFPGDEYIDNDKGAEIEYDKNTVIFIDVSGSMMRKERGIEYVINACNKYRVGMIFYNTGLVLVGDSKTKVRKMPTPTGGTLFSAAYEEYITFNSIPENIYVVTDGVDGSLIRFLTDNENAKAWEIETSHLPKEIKRRM